MADRFRAAAEFRARMRGQSACVTVDYCHASQSVSVSAGIGQSNFEQVSTSGVLTASQSRDYFVSAAALVFSLVEIEPAEGDRITETDPRTGEVRVFEVMSFAGQPCWRWHDSQWVTRRIHTKQVS